MVTDAEEVQRLQRARTNLAAETFELQLPPGISSVEELSERLVSGTKEATSVSKEPQQQQKRAMKPPKPPGPPPLSAFPKAVSETS